MGIPMLHRTASLAVEEVDSGVLALRGLVTSVADKIQLRVRVVRARLDADAADWVREMRRKVGTESLCAEIDQQPSPGELVAWWRSTSAS